MIRVKVFLTLDVDPEEYPIPADENVALEIEEGIQEYFYDVDGAVIKNIKTIMEWNKCWETIYQRTTKTS